jgi:hypothetical protein
VKALVFVITTVFISFSYAQNLGQEVWLETGVSYQPVKRWTFITELNQRYNNYGLATLFPQISLKYKLTKWLRPSLDYRWIASRAFLEPYQSIHRLNANLQGVYRKKRCDMGLRLRYQYSFHRISSSYDAEFDQAWRVKPSLQYNIKDCALSLMVSAEFFYDPTNHAEGKQFTRNRYYAGFDFDIQSVHKFSFGAYLDRWLNTVPRVRLMYSLGYSISIEKDEAKERPQKGEDIRSHYP